MMEHRWRSTVDECLNVSRIESFLQGQLDSGPIYLAQVRVGQDLSVCHREDFGLTDLERHTDPHAAAEIARWDNKGNYRPLKGAPTLRRSWILELSSIADLRVALDLLYPAAIANWLAWQEHRLTPTPLRDTLARQSGMFRKIGQLTDSEAEAVTAQCCNSESGCLRRVLWPITLGQPHTLTEPAPTPSPQEIPYLCPEACNFWIAAAHGQSKKN